MISQHKNGGNSGELAIVQRGIGRAAHRGGPANAPNYFLFFWSSTYNLGEGPHFNSLPWAA